MIFSLLILTGLVRAETITLRRLAIPTDSTRPVRFELDAGLLIKSEDQTGELAFLVLHRFITDDAGARLTTANQASETIKNWPVIRRAYQTLAARVAKNSERNALRDDAAALLRDRAWQTTSEGYGDLSKRAAGVLERLTKPIRNARTPVHPVLKRIVAGRDYLVPARWSAREDVRLVAAPDAIVVDP